MKKILVAAIILLSISISHAQISGATLTASGLTCSMCSKSIFTALQKVNFIDKIKPNIAESSFEISFKKDAAVDFDAIRKAVEGAGFSVAKLQITANFNNLKVQNDVMINVDGENFHFLNVPVQILNGEKTLTLVDEHFINEKDHRKYGQYTTMKCFTTGVTADCCSKNIVAGKRIYHVTI